MRAALRLWEGDEIACVIEPDRVVLTRAPAGAADDPFQTVLEWDGAVDTEAHATL